MANATSKSSIFAAAPAASASGPPKSFRIRSASRSASAPVGFASSAACSERGVNAAESCSGVADTVAHSIAPLKQAIAFLVMIIGSLARTFHNATRRSSTARKSHRVGERPEMPEFFRIHDGSHALHDAAGDVHGHHGSKAMVAVEQHQARLAVHVH